eukprot:TRINITY_DN37265_c0_g1_i1.p1 TRINITY_DN37265_c0_g1~~TRINITY_DN37265_c0_g1_i1.p1  ORF type:complete len:700 (+),score=173.50 TRINITY_DN37265_c0_g1_i1:278-2101(+)
MNVKMAVIEDAHGLEIHADSSIVTSVQPGGSSYSSGLTEGMKVLSIRHDNCEIALKDFKNPSLVPFTVTYQHSPIIKNSIVIIAAKEVELKSGKTLARHTKGFALGFHSTNKQVLAKFQDTVIWIDTKMVTGGRPHTTLTEEEKRDVAVMLTQAYSSDGVHLEKEEYSELCKDVGMDNMYELAKNDGGKVTSKGLKSTAGRLLSDHEQVLRDIALSKSAAAEIGKTRDTVCAGKAEGMQPTTLSSVNIELTSKKLIAIFSSKSGTVLDELLENFIAPKGTDKLLVLAEASRALFAQKSKFYPGKTQSDLLLMLLYTMAGPDIDQLMQFRDVPQYGGDEWTEYTKSVSPDRNGAMFSAVNGIMRGVSAPDFDWGCVKKWVKTICHLYGLCVGNAVSADEQLARGLAGLPDPVVASHKTLKPGSELHWTAPSSCAVDPSVAHSYIKGQAANAVKTSGGSILFNVSGVAQALPLQKISKYPKEAEVLVPPLSTLKVKKIGHNEEGGYLDIVLEWESASKHIPNEILKRIGKESKDSTAELVRRSEEKDNAVALLIKKPAAVLSQHPPWLPTSPRPGFRTPQPASLSLDHHSYHAVTCYNAHSPTSPRRQR